MSGPQERWSGSELSEQGLDAVFASARTPGPAELGAADRFLARFREEEVTVNAASSAAPPAPRPVHPAPRLTRLALLAATALSAAAMLGGALLLRPAPAAPSSEAYAAYSSALGEGW